MLRKRGTKGGPRPLVTPTAQWVRAAKILEDVRGSLRRRKGVTGVDLGPERSGGSLTGRLAIRVHVRAKLPVESMDLRRRLPDKIMGIPVDVVPNVFRSSACPASGAVYRTRHDPLFGGFAIGPTGIPEMGTLGIIVVDGGQTEHGLTCAHVVGEQVGLTVVQPHGSSPANAIGDVRDSVLNNKMDAAVVRLNGQRTAGAGVFGLGAIAAQPLDVPDYWQDAIVSFAGACSGRRKGVLTSATFTGDVESPSGTVTVSGHLVIESKDSQPMGRQGDSGALVVYEGQAIGIVRAVSDDDAGTVLATRILPILDRFGISIAT